MKKKYSLLTILFFTALLSHAQNVVNSSGSSIPHRTCGTEIIGEEFEEWLQPLIREQQKSNAAQRTSTVFNIPVVFHVIHIGTNVGIGYNISDAQINSQIAVLNEDFRKLNADTANTPGVFQGVAADCEVNFCLAQTDPNGNPTTGIERINRNTAGWTAPPYQKTYIDATIKPASIWNAMKYLNIWIVPDMYSSASQLLGYATFPAGSTLSGLTSGFGTAANDGVVLWYKCTGRTGLLDANYNKGRTATHEIGHWLGLRHIWGDATCGNDYCSDTPPQNTANFGVPVFPSTSSCTGNAPNGDQFMNYMDYCDDIALNMFTTAQRTRVQTVLLNAPMRVSQRNSTACDPPTTASLNNIDAGPSVSLYPNPAKEVLNVTIAAVSSHENLTWKITNIQGALIMSGSLNGLSQNSFAIDLVGMAKGLYLFDIENGSGRTVQKLEIQ